MRFLILSDAPNLPTGLGRIARDICAGLHQDGHEIAQLGWDYDDSRFPWPVFPIRDHGAWGQEDLPRVWWKAFGNQPGVVLTVWDPSRCFHATEAAAKMNVRLWGYFAIDSVNRGGVISGPAAVALSRYQRVLAYGRFGAEALKRTLGKRVQWLPHGLDQEMWQDERITKGVDLMSLHVKASELPKGDEVPGVVVAFGHAPPPRLVGCVASNQPRKDLGLLFETFAMLRDSDPSLAFWLHTDVEVRAWSIPGLAEDFGLGENLLVTTPETIREDQDLARLYAQCLVTIAPGSGEGFCYPIVESLSVGVPAIHGRFGGGAEWVPREEWLCEPIAYRLDGPYALRRPIYRASDWFRAAQAAIAWKRSEPSVVREYCRGAVAHLDWRALWPRWRGWVGQGLAEIESGAA